MNASPQQWLKTAEELQTMKAKRAFLDDFMQYLVKNLVDDQELANKIITSRGTSITNFHCHEVVVKQFLGHCFHGSKDSYALSKVYMLVNLCENGVDAQRIVDHMKVMCPHIDVHNFV
ncbi:hypothetical protein AB6A40_008413 [Gnathostoma spinigerum]|uniref:Legumain prodomain domain-containing protein n=1 Tax=Gnathostoma spinigerum TaxID=75299 RepID=A0ABD6EP06_9BILA